MGLPPMVLVLSLFTLITGWCSSSAVVAVDPSDVEERGASQQQNHYFGDANIKLPLRTESRWIVDSSGKRVKFACVSWYGSESMDYVVGGLQASTIGDISHLIKKYGFNCVRLIWSNALVQHNPTVNNKTILAANLDLVGLPAMTIFDRVVESLASNGLMIILDNHVSDANWCCSDTDENGLWYNTRYSYDDWINDWKGLVARYVHQPAVVGTDLRNELRKSCGFPDGCRTPVWGGGDPNIDWHRAAQLGGNAVLSVNPNLLIIVEGLSYSSDQRGVYSLPLVLSISNRVVYEAHEYSFFHNPQITSYAELNQILGDNWGYILEQGKDFTAPVWVGEFGTCHTDSSCISGQPGTAGFWFSSFIEYLVAADIDWGYWAIDGTQSTGTGRSWGQEDSYGIVTTNWKTIASLSLLQKLISIQNATQGPLL